MCWIGRREDMHVADKDIHVFKIMANDKGKFKSYHKSYDYNTNENNVEIDIHKQLEDGNFVEIEEGYHSYSYSMLAYSFPFSLNITDEKLYPKWFFYGSNVIVVSIVDCIIQKGSIYFENEDGEIVSSNIIVTDNFVNLSDCKVSYEQMRLVDIFNSKINRS